MNARQSADGPGVTKPRTVTVVTPGASFKGVLVLPRGPWRSGAVLVSDGQAGDEDTVEAARGLAGAGHAALVIAGEAVGGDTVPFETIAERIDACLACLRAEAPAPVGRWGVVGFGVGSFPALVAGYRCRVGVAVSFYGEGPARLREVITQLIDAPRPHAAPLLFLLGGEDTAVRPADLGAIRERLEAFGMRHTFIIYPRTRGAFCRKGSPEYRAAAAEDAWARLVEALATAPRLRHRFSRKGPRTDADRGGATTESPSDGALPSRGAGPKRRG
jgi:dienelactone hydrolase